VARKTGLGKGLGSLISETTLEAHAGQELAEGNEPSSNKTEIPINRIHRNEHQPRTQFDEEELQELAESIKQVGVLQPILVRPDGDSYQIIAGERRYQAAKKAGLKKIPAIIKTADDKETLELALIENIQRSNLNSIEEARAYQEILSTTDATQEELAKRLSKSRSSIANTLRLLDLPQDIQQLVMNGGISAGHARALLPLQDKQDQIELATRIIVDRLSVRQVEDLVKKKLAEKDQQKKQDKRSQAKSPRYAEAEKRLSARLGAPVKLKAGTGKSKSKIEILVSSDDELQRIIEIIESN
jgi:ParB family chromosome partitioning protein